MQQISQTQYANLRNNADVLEADSFGDKVLRLEDGTYIKLFRRKRLLSSALLWPYAARFAHNAQALAAAGVPCPRILAIYRIASIKRDLVHYAPLPGETLRQLYNRQATLNHHAALGQFVAKLHHLGIYFRSLHLGNVVLGPNNQLGLIDIADLKRQHYPLSKNQRLRNLRHLFRNDEDRKWLNEGPFLQSYIEHSGRKFNLDLLRTSIFH